MSKRANELPVSTRQDGCGRAVAALCVLALAAAVPAGARGESAEWCDSQWEVATSDPGEGLLPAYETLLARWRQYAGKCAGTVVFEARLAFLYALNDEPEKAREALKSVPAAASPYQHLVDVASLQTEMAEIFKSRASDKQARLERLEAKYAALVARYPEWPQGYILLGGLQTSLDHHPEAIKTLIAGLNHIPKDKRLAPNLWSLYRHLAVSYAESGDYRNALRAADIAYELNKGVTSDPQLMFSAAKAYAGTGDFESARKTLALIALKEPRVKNDPRFLGAQEFVNSRMAETPARR